MGRQDGGKQLDEFRTRLALPDKTGKRQREY
jgi:hypothetical protein